MQRNAEPIQPEEENEPVVAFVSSLVVAVLLVVPFFVVKKRRPPGTPLTWGEAMVAATWAFFLMFWVFAVVPHQWLSWADNELGWRTDKLVLGPWNVFEPQEAGGAFPFTINYQVVRDIIAVGIYVVFLGGLVAAWAAWQGRGTVKSTEVEKSTYGRPLVKKA